MMVFKIFNKKKNGSGCYFKEILSLEIHTVDYNEPTKGSSYIPLPDNSVKKESNNLSWKQKGSKMFFWSILIFILSKLILWD